MKSCFADVRTYPQEVRHLLYEDESGAVVGLGEVQLLDPVPVERVAPLRALLGGGDLYLVYQCALVLTAWGDPVGLAKMEEFVDMRIDRQGEIAPHRIYGYDNVYDEMADAVGLFALSSAGCRADRVRVLRRILALYGPCFFESKLKHVLLTGDMPELLPDVQAAVLRALALGRTDLASQLLPPLARWLGEAVQPLLAQFMSAPDSGQEAGVTVNIAEALSYLPPCGFKRAGSVEDH